VKSRPATARRSHLTLAIGLSSATALILTFPLIFHMSSVLVRTEPSGELDWNDTLMFLAFARTTELTSTFDLSFWQVIFAVPDFDMPPSYAFFVGRLGESIGVVAAHNCFMLLAIALSTFFTFILAYRFTRDGVASGFGAVMFGSANYLIHHVLHGHGNQVVLFLVPAILYCFELLIERITLWRIAFLGTILGLCVLSASQLTVYLSLVLPLYLAIRLGGRIKDPKFWGALVAAGAFGLIVGGYYIALRSQLPHATYERDLNLYYSIHSLGDLVDANSETSLGLIPALLCALGIGLAIKERNRAMVALSVVLIVTVLLSIGPVANWAPYEWFYSLWPFAKRIRTPLRFIICSLTACAILNAYALGYLRGFLNQRLGKRAAVLALCGLFAITALTRYAVGPRYFLRRPGPGGIWVQPVDEVPVLDLRRISP
jgi:hypothetical protein